MSKGQGTIEYLVIIAIIVVIALVVVSLLIGQTSNATTVNEQQSKLYWSSQPLAITDSVVGTDGTILIVLKNNTGDWINLSSITINNTSVYPDNFQIAHGESKAIYLNKNSLATINSQISLAYTTPGGIIKTQMGTTNLVNTQTESISPSSSATLLQQSDCFDWNSQLTQHPICTCNDLNTIDYNSTSRAWTYILQNNIDFRNCDPSYTAGAGWDPVGSLALPFTGNFLGNNKTIKGLYINQPDQNNLGLFGYVSSADINDIGVIDHNVNGFYYVGGLVGYNYSGSKTNNAYSTGDTNGTSFVGGLVGYNYSSSLISNSYSTGNTTGITYIGGLVGYNTTSAIIDRSYSTGNTIGESYYVGGLAGRNYSSSIISNSYSTGNTTGRGSYTGGLVGYNRAATINNSYSTGSTTGVTYTGGLTGFNYNGAKINNSYSTGNTTGGSYTAGLVGVNYYNNSIISNSYSTGNTIGGTYVGGLAGRNYTNTSIVNSYSTGTVKGTSYPGGLVGYNDSNGFVFNSFSTGTVIGTSNAQGVIGYNDATSAVINLYWFDSNASDNATTCYNGGDANCTILSDTNYTILFDSSTDLYDTNQPFWTFGSDKNWTARADNYPTLSWQGQ